MRKVDSSMQSSVYKIKITKCKICSLEKNQCLNFSSNKELKKHVIQAHRDSIYYDIAMELIQWVRLKSLAYCVKTKEEIENPRFTLNSAQLGDISQDNTSPIMLISRFWDN